MQDFIVTIIAVPAYAVSSKWLFLICQKNMLFFPQFGFDSLEMFLITTLYALLSFIWFVWKIIVSLSRCLTSFLYDYRVLVQIFTLFAVRVWTRLLDYQSLCQKQLHEYGATE